MKYWRHIAAVFAACLVMVLLVQPAEAVGGQQGAFTYELKGNGTAVITKFDWSKHTGGDVYVPRSIDGYQVTTIGTLAFSDTSINNNLMSNKPNFKAPHCGQEVAIILPDTITVIEDKAFFWTSISACDIPANVQIIGAGAFAGCENIRQFSVNSGNRTYAVIDGVLFHKARKELVSFPHNRSKYTIPDGIKSIGQYAFFAYGRGNTKLELIITSPVSLTTVDDYAFYGAVFNDHDADKLHAQHIGNYSFAHCCLPWGGDEYYRPSILIFYENGYKQTSSHSVYSIWLAPVSIGDYAFYDCTNSSGAYSRNMTNIDCRNLSSIGEGAFKNSRYVHPIYLEQSSITQIPAHAFENSSCFISSLPPTLLTIEEYAFANYGSTIHFKIPASVNEIQANAFSNSSVTITFAEDSHLQSIGNRAFFELRTVASEIILPEGLEIIGPEAFYLSTSKGIEILSVPSSVTTIGDNVVNRTITVLQVEPGSYADIWASENGFPMQVNDTSWLFE